ncbi:hypothetical protein F1C15_15100 [Frigoribacterium sp. NBH87]|uniref:hypothetical protein n=1 Tax=Frigoribacterium sp. NBH87 TaxID=2596916 RepID=UPI0016282242|nr:hypothetical protein [Frigoribacterium sp. NBH87]QNE44966.1 hypothetical protein F1C15_15100 [Frigoribacterium sp. NBH87]
MGLKTTLDLDELTWGDLLAFSDIGRAAGVGDDEKVEQTWSQNSELEALAVDLPAAGLQRRPVISAEEGIDFAAVLAEVLLGEGDARAYLGKLTELRDRLLGVS